jgi:two-component system NtrC family sensor kinase
MKCPRCREVASPKAKFCAGCGVELAARATPPGADAPPALEGGLEPVLAAIARTAARLCGASDAQISLVEADCLRQIVHCGTRRSARAVGETYPLNHGIVSALAVLDRRAIHIRDLRAAARTRFKELAAQVALGTRTVLASPLLRDGSAIGVILLQRKRVRPFTSKQIALLQAFADQAAIERRRCVGAG